MRERRGKCVVIPHMKLSIRLVLLIIPLFLIPIDALAEPATQAATAPSTMPTEWVDAATGHRVVRLSREDGSENLYFHQNGYTPDGRKLVMTTPSGISAVDLQTREIEPIVSGDVKAIIVGRKSGDIYYRQGEAVYATSVNSKVTRKVVELPHLGEGFTISIASVNSDETLLAGTIVEGGAGPITGPDGQPLSKAKRINERFAMHLPMDLITINIATGEMKKFNHSTDWLNHLQFSPTDPNLILFCHEGPWQKVDRTWTIRADGTGLTQIHRRTMAMEIEGHEFFSRDGQTIWYDLQTPKGEVFWLGGLNLGTGERTWYHLLRDEWSVHFSVSPDGQLFAGDGGGPGMVARAENGKWIYLFHPELTKDNSAPEVDTKSMIHTGVFRSEKLVDMSKHDYLLEPNVTFTPDMKWIVFRSNMFGASQVFEVEVAKAGM